MDRMDLSRRSVLGTIASTTALGGFTTSSVASRSADDIYETALRIRESRGWNAYAYYLSKHGFDVQAYVNQRAVPRSSTEEFSTQQLRGTTEEFNLILTLIEYTDEPDYIYADIVWEHTDVDFNWEYGEPPRDYAGLHWPAQDYTRVNDYVVSGPYVCDPESNGGCGDLTPTGIAVGYNDSTHTASFTHRADESGDYGPDDSVIQSSWFTIKLKKEDDGPPSERVVVGDYVHTYSSVDVTGVSIGTGGLGVSLSDNSKKWDWHVDKTEDEKQIRNPCGEEGCLEP